MDGPPEVRREKPPTYDLPFVVEYVVIPLAVNVTSTVLIGVATRLFRRYRPDSTAKAELVDESQDDQRVVAITADPETEPPAA